MRIQLQSILLPREQVCSTPELYYHKSDERISGEDGQHRTIRVDFDGYFNLFYIKKRKIYTELSGLYLELCVRDCELLHLMHDGEEIRTIPVSSQTVCVELPYEQYADGCFWFALSGSTASEPEVISGMFYGEIDDAKVRPVKLGIDICTFRRETYVERNLRQICEQVLDRTRAGHIAAGLQTAECIDIFVIDNGQTLSSCEPVQDIVRHHKDRIHIIPNRNAGGSGGFTRGMIEILNRKESQGFTHVLLMDDDAVIEPDTLVRIYGFLSTLKEQWKNITVGGALLREEHPHILFCAGEWWENGYTVSNPDFNLDLRTRTAASCAYLTETGHEHDRYSGWWCCCYSLNTVRADNLPLPLFIHHDDIEYGIRNRDAGIVFLNGVNIWHRDVELAMPGTNMYYDVRNTLIEMALQDVSCGVALRWLGKHYAGELLRYRYKNALFVIRGIRDYLRGPGWLHEQLPEQLHAKLMADAEKNISIDDTKRKIFHVRTPLKQILHEKKYYLQDPGTKKTQQYSRSFCKMIGITASFARAYLQLLSHYDKTAGIYKKQFHAISSIDAWTEYLERKEGSRQ